MDQPDGVRFESGVLGHVAPGVGLELVRACPGGTDGIGGDLVRRCCCPWAVTWPLGVAPAAGSDDPEGEVEHHTGSDEGHAEQQSPFPLGDVAT